MLSDGMFAVPIFYFYEYHYIESFSLLSPLAPRAPAANGKQAKPPARTPAKESLLKRVRDRTEPLGVPVKDFDNRYGLCGIRGFVRCMKLCLNSSFMFACIFIIYITMQTQANNELREADSIIIIESLLIVYSQQHTRMFLSFVDECKLSRATNAFVRMCAAFKMAWRSAR